MDKKVGILYGGFYNYSEGTSKIYSYDILVDEYGEPYVCVPVFTSELFSTKYIDWNRQLDKRLLLKDNDWVIYSKDKEVVEAELMEYRNGLMANLKRQLTALEANPVRFIEHITPDTDLYDLSKRNNIVNKVAQQVITAFCSEVTIEDIKEAYNNWFKYKPEYADDHQSFMELFDDSYLGLTGGRSEYPTNFDFCFGIKDVNRSTSVFDNTVKDFRPSVSEEDWDLLTQNGEDLENYYEIYEIIKEPIREHLKGLGIFVLKVSCGADNVQVLIDNNRLKEILK